MSDPTSGLDAYLLTLAAKADAAEATATAALDQVAALTARVAALETGTPDTPPVNPPANTSRPFSDTSPWNTPAGNPTGSNLTAAVRAQLWGGGLGINIDRYSCPVYTATTADPQVTIVDIGHGNRTLTAHVPTAAVPAAGTDSNMAIIQPDGRVIDVWVAKRNGSDRIDVQRFGVCSIDGPGTGPAVDYVPAGIRAAGCPWLAGLIRTVDIDAGSIDHALAMALPATFYKWTRTDGGGDGHLDPSGYGLSKGYVYPATEQDYDAQWVYKGQIPMGSRFRIPADVDVTTLGLTDAAVMVAKAAQTYGVYVLDKTDNGGSWAVLYGEPALAPTPWADQVWRNGSLEKIRQQLVHCV